MDPVNNTKLAKLKKDLAKPQESSIHVQKAGSKKRRRQSRNRPSRASTATSKGFTASQIRETYSGRSGNLDFSRKSDSEAAIHASREKHRQQWMQRWKSIGLSQGQRVTIPRQVVKDLVRATAWWYGHPNGPMKAPKHCENIYLTAGSTDDWCIDFGANTFLIGNAVRECRTFLQRQKFSGEPMDDSLTERQLWNLVCSNVAHQSGKIYYQYPVQGDFMHFGTQAINIKEFVALLKTNLVGKAGSRPSVANPLDA